MTIASRIRTARIARGLRQRDLAALVSLDWHYVSQLERGIRNPSPTTAVRLGEVLGIDLGLRVPRCRIDDCAGRHHGRGYCHRHYYLAKYRGLLQ